TLLGELLGRADLRELLDAEVVAETERRLQWLTDDRRPRDAEDAAEVLRMLGDLSTVEATERGIATDWLPELEVTKRAIRVRVAAAIEQLQGLPLPASAWERLILPARVADYTPAYLDELCAAGEVVWAGAGTIGGDDGWVALAFADTAPLLLPAPTDSLATTPV